jgi:hypothetical protein
MKAHYYIEINGKPQGPFTIEELKQLTITKENVVWKEDLPNWVKATEIEEISKLIKIPVKPNKIAPPPLPVNPIDVTQTQHINRIEIIKTILRLNRKWFFAIILLTVASYVLIAYLEGGFQAIQLRNKYAELIKTPQEQARIYSLSEDKRFARELEDRRNQPVDTNKKSPLELAYDSANKGKVQAPTVSESFAKGRAVPITQAMNSTGVSLEEIRQYIDNPDPTDPNLDNNMIHALSDKINNSFGLPTIIEALGIFIISLLMLIANSRLWKS